MRLRRRPLLGSAVLFAVAASALTLPPTEDPLHSFTATYDSHVTGGYDRVTLTVKGERYALKSDQGRSIEGHNERGIFRAQPVQKTITLYKNAPPSPLVSFLDLEFALSREGRNGASAGGRHVHASGFPFASWTTTTLNSPGSPFSRGVIITENGKETRRTWVQRWKTVDGARVPEIIATRRAGQARPEITRLVSFSPTADETLLGTDQRPYETTRVSDAKSRTLTTFDARGRVVQVEDFPRPELWSLLILTTLVVGAGLITRRALRGALLWRSAPTGPSLRFRSQKPPKRHPSPTSTRTAFGRNGEPMTFPRRSVVFLSVFAVATTTHALPPSGDVDPSFTATYELPGINGKPARLTVTVSGRDFAVRNELYGRLDGQNARGAFSITGFAHDRTLTRTLGEPPASHFFVEGLIYALPNSAVKGDQGYRTYSTPSPHDLAGETYRVTAPIGGGFATEGVRTKFGKDIYVTRVEGWKTVAGQKIPALIVQRSVDDPHGPGLETRLVSVSPHADSKLIDADSQRVHRTVVRDAKARTITTFDAQKRLVKVETWSRVETAPLLPWFAGALALAAWITRRALRGVSQRGDRQNTRSKASDASPSVASSGNHSPTEENDRVREGRG